MGKKTISFSICTFWVIAFLCSWCFSIAQATWQPFQQLADYAIQLTKQATSSYGTYTIPNASTISGTTITLNASNILATEQDFKNQVNIARTNWFATWSYTGFLNTLAQRNTITKATINNSWLDSTKRATAMLSDNFYNNYILLRNNPKFNTGKMWVWIPVVSWSTATNWTTGLVFSGLVYSPISWYQTLWGKKYFTWSTQDGRFWFSTLNNKNDIRKSWFKDLQSLYNHLEFQNRIMYLAPNSRKYAIFKQNIAFSFVIRFRRDNWTISENRWETIEDAKAYINQHNQPVK